MRRLAFALCLAALPADAETLSAEIGRTGLAAVEARLAALPAPSDEERFTLGGVHFLRAVELSFQDRWRQGLTDNTGMLPFLRLPVMPNPAPEPFAAQTITGIFTQAHAKLAEAASVLTAIPETSDFGAEIALGDLWFDVNGSGARDPGEDLTLILGRTLGMAGGSGDPAVPATIRFDVADAAWLAAYAELLSAISDVVRAYDPTEPITRVLDTRAAMARLGPPVPDPFLGSRQVPDPFDLIAIILAALAQTPDAPLMAEAQQHLLAMIAQNRQFWLRVAQESDDHREWLPNSHQHAALGLTVPEGAAQAWAGVLNEMEAVVTGAKLLPYWRVGAPAGVNLGKIFADPRPVDVPGWIQGWAALPYLQQGEIASTAAIMAFDNAVQGNAMFFAIYFN